MLVLHWWAVWRLRHVQQRWWNLRCSIMAAWQLAINSEGSSTVVKHLHKCCFSTADAEPRLAAWFWQKRGPIPRKHDLTGSVLCNVLPWMQGRFDVLEVSALEGKGDWAVLAWLVEDKVRDWFNTMTIKKPRNQPSLLACLSTASVPLSLLQQRREEATSRDIPGGM